jgi:hypothetical protein
MERNRVEDDLKTIRQIMERTRSAAGRGGGRIMILWGATWFVGFLCSQFVPEGPAVGWIWLVLNSVGIGGTIGLALRMPREGVKTPIWQPILLWWTSLFVFDGLVLWIFGVRTGRDLLMLLLLSVALGYVQFGLFTHWVISATGVALAAMTVAAALLVPDYFFLAMGVLGGGTLIGTGLWFTRQERAHPTRPAAGE